MVWDFGFDYSCFPALAFPLCGIPNGTLLPVSIPEQVLDFFDIPLLFAVQMSNLRLFS